jgi:hypothetical protein
MRWRRLDVAGREEASAARTAVGWGLTGELDVEESGVSFHLHYEIELDDAWCTRAVLIEGTRDGALVHFELAADGSGHWLRDVVPADDLDGTIDIDLGFTPATNTLPIRRLDLAVGERATVRCAWLRFPELRFEALEQTYVREAEQRFRFLALIDGEEFSARLDTDPFGRVLRYEGLWEAEVAEPGVIESVTSASSQLDRRSRAE